jgi:hypothetical protein
MKKPRARAQFECAILVDGRTAWKGKRPVRVYRRIGRATRGLRSLFAGHLLLTIFFERFNEWIEIQNLLADTGADLTLLPSHLGELLLPDIRDAKNGIGGVTHRETIAEVSQNFTSLRPFPARQPQGGLPVLTLLRFS